MEVTVVIPTLNEELGIKEVIKRCHEFGFRKILVLDGYSTDNTVEVAKSLGAKVMTRLKRGKGNQFSLFLSEYPIKDDDVYIMLDGDASYDAKYMPQFVDMIKNFDIVSGHRTTIKLTLSGITYFLGNKLISFIGFILYGKWMDICTGYWAFTGKTLKRMDITAKGFDLEADFFTNICKLKLNHDTISIEYYDRIGERKLRKSDAIKIIGMLLRKRF